MNICPQWVSVPGNFPERNSTMWKPVNRRWSNSPGKVQIWELKHSLHFWYQGLHFPVEEVTHISQEPSPGMPWFSGSEEAALLAGLPWVLVWLSWELGFWVGRCVITGQRERSHGTLRLGHDLQKQRWTVAMARRKQTFLLLPWDSFPLCLFRHFL